jgi:unsaturated chondroitin disaccharide hydrolase
MRCILFIGLLCSLSAVQGQKVNMDRIIKDAEAQTAVLLREIEKVKAQKPGLVSPKTIENGELKMIPAREWTSGFFPGELWFLYEYTKKEDWKTRALAFTANIENEKTNGGTHDMGFKIYNSFGNGYRLTKDNNYKDIIIQSARTLITRFKPVTGVIRSWDHNRDKWGYPVIIDNMMNLELLFEATKLSGDSSFWKVAVSHANTTMKNHFRPDYSSYHVVDYDTVTGQVVRKNTHQGYSHESAWSRGQAWALYAYAMCYRETRDPAYLKLAENIAKFILNHKNLPKDMVPYYDFDAPGIPDEPRDASAAAIIASGLYELSLYSKDRKYFRVQADKILESLTNNYRSPLGENKGFILLHSTGSKPGKFEIDVPLDYADYYYLEAVLRAKKLREGRSLF